jgi:hypothetical protein
MNSDFMFDQNTFKQNSSLMILTSHAFFLHEPIQNVASSEIFAKNLIGKLGICVAFFLHELIPRVASNQIF